MDIGLHHRGIDAHLAALNHTTLARPLNQPLMQLPDGFAAHRLRDARQRLRVRYFVQPNARELAIGQVQAHLALQRIEAPVAHVLEQQQPQHRFGRSLRTSARRTLSVALGLRLEYRLDQLLVFKKPVGLHHPRLPQTPDIDIYHAFPQGPLRFGLPLRAHDPVCGKAETGSIVNVFAPSHTSRFTPIWSGTPYFATESS